MNTIEIIEPISNGFERQVMAGLQSAGGSDVDININCAGGDVKETLGVCNRLADYPGKTTANIIGLAASCASWVPVYCNTVTMRTNSLLMIHNATAKAGGDWKDLERASRDLKLINEQIAGMAHDKTKMPIETILNYMEESETFTAAEAKRLGFVDKIIDSAAVSFRNLAGFAEIENKIPEHLKLDISKPSNPAVNNRSGIIAEIDNQIQVRNESMDRLRLRVTRAFKNMDEEKGMAGTGTRAGFLAQIRRLTDGENGLSLVEISRALSRFGSQARRTAGTLSAIISGDISNPPGSLVRFLRRIPTPRS